MRIIYGITKADFGGAQRYVFELASELKRQGHEIKVILGGYGKLEEKLKQEKIEVISLDNLKRDISLVKEWKSFWEILKILKKEKPNIFHINSSKMGGLGALAGRIARVEKIIFTGHAWTFNEPRPWWQRIFIKFLSWLTIILAHKTICVSEKTKSDIASWPFIKKKLVVVRNGIKPFAILEKEKARKRLGEFKPDNLIVGTIAELHKIKGLDVLLEAWKKFSQKNRNVHLAIIGAGEELKNLENIAKNLDISDTVAFLGFINEARNLLLGFDIFVLPSRSEGFPYALIEAGSIGLPVIATRVGGIPEVLENGVNGIIIPKEDSEALFSSLVLLDENQELRKRLGIYLKETIDKNFSLEIMFRETFHVYGK